MILDTSLLIDVMNGLPEAINKIKRLNADREVQFIAAPSIFELWSGIAQSKKSEMEKKKVLSVLGTQTILNLDQKSAEEGGKIDGMLVKNGTQIDSEDCMIAGIAICNGEIIVTRNIAHFSRIKGLKIESY